MTSKKPKKSVFIHGPIRELTRIERLHYYKIKNILENKSISENIGYVPSMLSKDNKTRPLILSREIVKKIQFDHGSLPIENIIINANKWEYATTDVLGNPDKINLIKSIPNSDNYLLIAAVRINGFYIVTHFETKTMGSTNLKRLLKRGNVISRGPSIGL